MHWIGSLPTLFDNFRFLTPPTGGSRGSFVGPIWPKMAFFGHFWFINMSRPPLIDVRTQLVDFMRKIDYPPTIFNDFHFLTPPTGGSRGSFRGQICPKNGVFLLYYPFGSPWQGKCSNKLTNWVINYCSTVSGRKNVPFSKSEMGLLWKSLIRPN